MDCCSRALSLAGMLCLTLFASSAGNSAFAQDPASAATRPAASGRPAVPKPDGQAKGASPAADSESKQNPSDASERTELNLKGKTDAESGESRRNDNVQFNPIDNNALRDLNLRLGVSTTVVREFESPNRYFSADHGNRPEQPIHLLAPKFARIHGSAFETHENSIFAARAFFQVGGVKPAHENNYGFNLAIPFGQRFSLTLDGTQQKVRGSVNGNVLVPDATERTPLTTDPRLLPLVQKVLDSFPAELPNRPDIDSRALNTNSPQRIDTSQGSVFLDRAFSDHNHISARYGTTQQKVQSFQFVAGQNYNSDIAAHTARLTWAHAFSASSVLLLTGGFDRVNTQLTLDPRVTGAAISAFTINSVFASNSALSRVINDFQEALQFRRTKGKHAWTSGFSVSRRQFNSTENNNNLGSFLFTDNFGRDTVTNIRMGTPSRFSITVGNVTRAYRNWTLAGYIGDKWQVSQKLSLNFGLRYEAITAPLELHHVDAVPFGCDCNNLAPTFGFAYRLKNNWGLVRGAYGIHYGQLLPATYGQQRYNPPQVYSLSVDNPDFADPLKGFDLSTLNASTRSALIAISPNLVAPYSQQYNFSWEPSPFKRLKMQFGYVGSRTWKLYTIWSMNRAVPVDGIPRTLATVNDRRPDQSHYMISRVGNASRGYYDAARASIVLPPFHGVSVDASYSFSKAIDLGTNYSGTGASQIPFPQTDFSVNADLKGVSDFQQPHAFLARASFEMPKLDSRWTEQIFGNWAINGVLLMKTGTPFTVFAGSDAPGFGNVDGESADRVNVVDPSVLGRGVGNPDTSTLLLPRSAFAFMSATDLRGNIGRDTFHKGNIANVNAAVSRSWKVKDQVSLTFRAESVNFLNTPQFADPERNFTSKLFGRISNTLNVGRAFRFTLRVTF